MSWITTLLYITFFKNMRTDKKHSNPVGLLLVSDTIKIGMPAKLLQLCPTLCNPMDCSLLDSSVHGILQARILEWVAVPSSRGSSQPRDRTCVSYISYIGRRVIYHQRHLGSPVKGQILSTVISLVIMRGKCSSLHFLVVE